MIESSNWESNLPFLFLIFVVLLAACKPSEADQGFRSPEFPEIPERFLNEDAPELHLTLDGKLYYRDSLFSGYLVSYFSDLSISKKEGYLNGLKNGPFTGYFQDGSLRFARFHLNGLKVGIHEGWFANGQQQFQNYFQEGKSVGTHTKWYKDGRIYSIQNYEGGFERGLQQVWRPDGKLRSNYVVKSDGRKYGLLGIKRCTKLDGETQQIDPYTGK